MMRIRRHIPAMMAACVLASAGTAFAQDSAFGVSIIRTRPFDSVSTAGARAPGTMVDSGVARLQQNVLAAQSPIEITEVAIPEVDLRDTLLVSAIEVVFEQLDQTLLFFENLLRARAGLEPRVPTTPGNGDTNGDDNGGRDDDPRNPRDPRSVSSRRN